VANHAGAPPADRFGADSSAREPLESTRKCRESRLAIESGAGVEKPLQKKIKVIAPGAEVPSGFHCVRRDKRFGHHSFPEAAS
jgi:hypothetical protein